MLAMYPMVPLLASLGLGIALISYDGRLCWGFNADPKLVPDLEAFVAAIRSHQARVLASARPEAASEPAAPPRRSARSRADGGAESARSS
jgi:hypothetical protein